MDRMIIGIVLSVAVCSGKNGWMNIGITRPVCICRGNMDGVDVGMISLPRV